MACNILQPKGHFHVRPGSRFIVFASPGLRAEDPHRDPSSARVGGNSAEWIPAQGRDDGGEMCGPPNLPPCGGDVSVADRGGERGAGAGVEITPSALSGISTAMGGDRVLQIVRSTSPLAGEDMKSRAWP